MNELTVRPKRLNKKQRNCIDYWTKHDSETFGNLYQSALKAGFRPSYALNLSAKRPLWLNETVGLIQLEKEHIVQGIQAIARQAPNSKSPDDTRVKAYELLAKIGGLIDNKQINQTINVQPILNGESVKPRVVESKIVEQDTK